MTALTIIIILILVFFGASILGWILNIVGYILSFLFDGVCHLLGCFVWIIISIFVIGAIITLFSGLC